MSISILKAGLVIGVVSVLWAGASYFAAPFSQNVEEPKAAPHYSVGCSGLLDALRLSVSWADKPSLSCVEEASSTLAKIEANENDGIAQSERQIDFSILDEASGVAGVSLVNTDGSRVVSTWRHFKNKTGQWIVAAEGSDQWFSHVDADLGP